MDNLGRSCPQLCSHKFLSRGLYLCGCCAGSLNIIGGNTLLQTLTDKDKQGRIVSLFNMSELGLSALGGLLYGKLAEHNECDDTLLDRQRVILARVAMVPPATPKIYGNELSQPAGDGEQQIL